MKLKHLILLAILLGAAAIALVAILADSIAWADRYPSPPEIILAYDGAEIRMD